MKRKLFGFVGALVILLALVVLGGCKTDADDNGNKDVTITIKNTTSGAGAKKIIGVAAYSDPGTGTIWHLGTPNDNNQLGTFDPSITANAGAVVTFTLKNIQESNFYDGVYVQYGTDASDYALCEIDLFSSDKHTLVFKYDAGSTSPYTLKKE